MQCITSYPQPSFALAIETINRELRQKGHLITDESGCGDDDPVSVLERCQADNRQLMNEMRTQNFDVIRFATYRTAGKLRFVQKQTNFYLVDLWNVIEAFLETGISTLDSAAEVPVSVLETLLTCVFCALNKRLPNSAQINVGESVHQLYSFIVCAYDLDGCGQLRVLSIKASLVMLCAGKLVDKLKCIFSLVSDNTGHMVASRFNSFLQELLTLPAAVYEGPSFEYNESSLQSCFASSTQTTLSDFLDILMSEPGLQCLMWMPIFHRLATVENVYHAIACEGCRRESFTGFRYKCQRCYNYNLCQDCFWRGRTSGNHQNDHDVKEYSFFKSSSKQLSEMMKNSIQCVPNKTCSLRLPRNADDLSNDSPDIMPLSYGGRGGNDSKSPARRSASLDRSSTKLRSVQGGIQSEPDTLQGGDDDEHRLIARYTARLAADANNAMRSPVELAYVNNSNRVQRELIAQLEAKNRDIMHEIRRLRQEQDRQAALSQSTGSISNVMQSRNPVLIAELRGLRQRRDELERRMAALQASRKELVSQLEGLMNLLRSSANSPRLSPVVSPRFSTGRQSIGTRYQRDALVSSSGNVLQAFRPVATTGMVTVSSSGPSPVSAVCGMRNSLLVAADSVTDAMSSLVRELNSEASSGSEEGETNNVSGLSKRDEFSAWPKDSRSERRVSDPTQDPRSQGRGAITSIIRPSSQQVSLKGNNELDYENDRQDHLLPSRYGMEYDSCFETDLESCVRTDDEDGGNTDWEDATKRWINR